MKGALSHLTPGQVLETAEYLVSPEVGVMAFGDLADLTLDMMPQTLPPLKRRQLLEALKKAGKPTGDSTTGRYTG